MSTSEHRRTSKFLSLILRHKPQTINLELDAQGWADVTELINKAQNHGVALSIAEIKDVVATSDKQRFILSDDAARIRAAQGHSLQLDLEFQRADPPDILYHGTAERFLESILRIGLIKGQRHHVHLSAERGTALRVGIRHGKPAILLVAAAKMASEGCEFFLSENGVWLIDHVAPEFLTLERQTDPSLDSRTIKTSNV